MTSQISHLPHGKTTWAGGNCFLPVQVRCYQVAENPKWDIIRAFIHLVAFPETPLGCKSKLCPPGRKIQGPGTISYYVTKTNLCFCQVELQSHEQAHCCHVMVDSPQIWKVRFRQRGGWVSRPGPAITPGERCGMFLGKEEPPKGSEW